MAISSCILMKTTIQVKNDMSTVRMNHTGNIAYVDICAGPFHGKCDVRLRFLLGSLSVDSNRFRIVSHKQSEAHKPGKKRHKSDKDSASNGCVNTCISILRVLDEVEPQPECSNAAACETFVRELCATLRVQSLPGLTAMRMLRYFSHGLFLCGVLTLRLLYRMPKS